MVRIGPTNQPRYVGKGKPNIIIRSSLLFILHGVALLLLRFCRLLSKRRKGKRFHMRAAPQHPCGAAKGGRGARCGKVRCAAQRGGRALPRGTAPEKGFVCGQAPAGRRKKAYFFFISSASTAFWACRRFSAWSYTMECSPSITASVTSSPRAAGSGCM